MTLKECWEKAGSFPFIAKCTNYKPKLIVGFSDNKFVASQYICGDDIKDLETYASDWANKTSWVLMDYFDTAQNATTQDATALQHPTILDEPECSCVDFYHHKPECPYKAWNDKRAVRWSIG